MRGGAERTETDITREIVLCPTHGRCAGCASSKAPRPQVERFWQFVEPEPMSGCWLWIGASQPRSFGAYGVFQKLNRKTTGNAHRWAYEFYRGPIGPKLDLDHLCRVPLCVNPDHLQAVSRRTNLLRSRNLVAVNFAKTHCPFGHPFIGANLDLYISRQGYRIRRCRTCLRLRARAHRAAHALGQNVKSFEKYSRPSG